MLEQESVGCFERQKERQGSVTQSWGTTEVKLCRMRLTGVKWRRGSPSRGNRISKD